MKKILYGPLLTLLFMTNAEASSFKGFYAGAQVGYVYQPYKTNVYESYKVVAGGGTPYVPAYINSAQRKVAKGMSYGLFGGHGWVINTYYLGVEAGIENTTTTKTKTITLLGNDGAYWPFATAYHRGIVLSLGPRFGALINESSLAYIKVEGQVSQDSLRYQSISGNVFTPGFGTSFYTSSPFYRSDGQIKTVCVLGIGFEKSIDDLFLRIEYNYNFGAIMKQTKSYLQSGGGGVFDNADTQSVRYTASTIKIGMGWRF